MLVERKSKMGYVYRSIAELKNDDLKSLEWEAKKMLVVLVIGFNGSKSNLRTISPINSQYESYSDKNSVTRIVLVVPRNTKS